MTTLKRGRLKDKTSKSTICGTESKTERIKDREMVKDLLKEYKQD